MLEIINSTFSWLFLGSTLLIAQFIFFHTRAKKFKKSTRTLPGIVGSYGVMATDVVPDAACGKVEVHGTLWNAESFERIAQGTRVMIVAQDNLNLVVQRVE